MVGEAGVTGDGPQSTDDGRYLVIDGRRWRATDPAIPEGRRQELTTVLMAWRREVKRCKGTDGERAPGPGSTPPRSPSASGGRPGGSSPTTSAGCAGRPTSRPLPPDRRFLREGCIRGAGWHRTAGMDENGSPSAVLTLYTLDGTGDLLALRRAFRHRDAGGAWLPALHAHQEPDEDPVDAARRIALSSLGLRLHRVRVVEQAATRATPWCPRSTEEVGPVLVASTGRRVVTPDPTLYDDADLGGWRCRDAARAHARPRRAVADGVRRRPRGWRLLNRT